MSYGSTQKWLASAFVEHHCWQNRASHKISLSLSIIKTQVPTYYMVIGTLFYMYIIVLCNNTGIISLEIKLTRLIWEDFFFFFLPYLSSAPPYQRCRHSVWAVTTPPTLYPLPPAMTSTPYHHIHVEEFIFMSVWICKDCPLYTSGLETTPINTMKPFLSVTKIKCLVNAACWPV